MNSKLTHVYLWTVGISIPIVAGAAGGGAVVMIAVILSWWYCCRRKALYAPRRNTVVVSNAPLQQPLPATAPTLVQASYSYP